MNCQRTNCRKKYAENRIRYEAVLKKRLADGEWIVAEDYRGTGIAWGLTWGGQLDYLEDINEDLLKPDLEILMNGSRFLSAIEKDHRNEMDGERIMICKIFHELLAERYGWIEINANQKIKKVQADIIEKISVLIN
ncbi:MAG: hypothetical protein WCJ51_03130, partial [Candidatus Moraniibacteriota bacterium]